MTYQNIMKMIPTIHAAQLASANAEMIKKKTSSKDLVGMGMKNIVGIEMIKLESGLIAGL